MKKIIVLFLTLAVVSLYIFAYKEKEPVGTSNRLFSSYTLLNSSWYKYKEVFINQDGRVIDYSQSSITTSEGQSYALLGSVWIDDKEAFDRVWQWTKDNLQREEDHLFGWKWGQRLDSTYGFLENGGENSASDGDTDMALALIFASNRWSDDDYLYDALFILDDIWNMETIVIRGKRYLTAGNWALSSSEVVLNPSYFAPYAWRIFAKVDEKNNWESLIDPAYEVLEDSSLDPLNRNEGVGLPPDWLSLKLPSGEIAPSEVSGFTTNYSFDAARIPLRIALDYKWNSEKRAYDYLKNNFGFLTSYFIENQKLNSIYSHDGLPLTEKENPVMYATSLGYFALIQPEMAEKIYKEKVLSLYSNDENSFFNELPYYEQNWLWFGAAFYEGYLIPIV